MHTGNVRFWQGFSVALVLAFVAALGYARYSVSAQSEERMRFTEIDVERINVIASDGTVNLVIANRDRAPHQVSDGQSRPRATGNKSPGITFFDDAGDEAGGLKIRGDRRAGRSAHRTLVFDQHRGDQILGLVSDENDDGRRAGLTVWDRPDVPLLELMDRYGQVLEMPDGPERVRLVAEFEACCRGLGATRMFAGKNRDRDAVIELSDARERQRLRLVVSAEGDARIEFLDEQGRPTLILPDQR